MDKALLPIGTPAPVFIARSPTTTRYAFDTAAGRAIVLCFFKSAAAPSSRAVLQGFLENRNRFDDLNAAFFGVSNDPQDEQYQRVSNSLPGIRYFWDFESSISALYKLASDESVAFPVTYVLDSMLRIVAVQACTTSAEAHVASILNILDHLPSAGPARLAAVQAPVLILPRVFEPDLCKALMDYYAAHGGRESGVMREVAGKTVEVMDHRHKHRRDCLVVDPALGKACFTRIRDRLIPEVARAFQFSATRMERQLVACYDAQEKGHFKRHRDNTTKGTAHRRFAVSLFLNSGEYDGGYLRFPEYGPALYAAPTGAAVVFSCSLLHEATPVTRGKRYMYLPFLYDEAAARVRAENLRYLEARAPGLAASEGCAA